MLSEIMSYIRSISFWNISEVVKLDVNEVYDNLEKGFLLTSFSRVHIYIGV